MSAWLWLCVHLNINPLLLSKECKWRYWWSNHISANCKKARKGENKKISMLVKTATISFPGYLHNQMLDWEWDHLTCPHWVSRAVGWDPRLKLKLFTSDFVSQLWRKNSCFFTKAVTETESLGLKATEILSDRTKNMHAQCVHQLNYSLVPRSFPPPVFDHLQYAKSRGGRHGRFSHVQWRQVGRGWTDGGQCPIIVTHKLLHWSDSSLPNNELLWRCFWTLQSQKWTVVKTWERG